MDVTSETLTRLRNSFARLAVELASEQCDRCVPVQPALPFSSMTETDWRRAVLLWRRHADELLADALARPCPACGSESSRELFASYDAHWFHECDGCGCWFVPRRVDHALFDRFFERCPEAAELARQMKRARLDVSQREADSGRIGGYLDSLLALLAPLEPHRRLAYLDVGCGVGHSLRAAHRRGLVARGIEADTTSVAIARDEGLAVNGVEEPIVDGPYHLVTFWETLEHIADPAHALRRYLPVLADDGLVAMTVPNLNALETRVLREQCSWVYGGYNTPGHINLFHLSSLERLLSQIGLTVLEAQGQFSANPFELLSYLMGWARGALDMLAVPPRSRELPEAVIEVLNNVWPGVALLEQVAVANPILRIVACRRGCEHHFEEALKSRRAAARDAVAHQARALIESETDWKAIAAQLHAEAARLHAEIDEARRRYARTIEGRVWSVLRHAARIARRLRSGEPGS